MPREKSPERAEDIEAIPNDQPPNGWMLASDALQAVKRAVRSESRVRKLLEDALKAGTIAATAKALVSEYDGYPVPLKPSAHDSAVSSLRIASPGKEIVLGKAFFRGRQSQYRPLPLEWEQNVFHLVEEPAGILKLSPGPVMAVASKRMVAYGVMLSKAGVRRIIKENASASYHELKHSALTSQIRKDALNLNQNQWLEALSSIIEFASEGKLENVFGPLVRGVKKDIEREITELVEKRYDCPPSEATARRKATWLINMNVAAKMANSGGASSTDEPA